MKIPTFNVMQFVDDGGYLTSQMQLYYDQLNVQLQNNLSDDGFVIPSLTTTQINSIADPNNANGRPDGSIWYDSQTKQFKGKVDGVVKVFQMV